MSAPFTNKFWELRSRHGRKRLFASPKLLWQAATEYFQWCLDNPFMEMQQAKSSGVPYKDKETNEIIWPSNTIELPKMRAFTMVGLCHYLDCNLGYFDEFEKALIGKEDKKSKDFSVIIIRIRETVYNQKFSGAAAGFLNANIIARDLGLIEKKDVNAKIDHRQLLDNMSEEQLIEVARLMLKQQNTKQ